MKVQRQALKQYLAYRRLSYQQLSDKCRPAKVSKSLIGHLVTGERRTTSPETAVAIEEALEAPPGSLFVPNVLPVATNDPHPKAVA